MTPTECVKLVRLVKAIAPAQKFDEMTPDMWHPLLEETSITDALEAVKRVGRRQPFISPADILAEVRVIRRERLDHADATFVFDGDPDDVDAYRAALAEHRRAIGDGQPVPEPPALTRSVPPKAIEGVFRRVPKDGAA